MKAEEVFWGILGSIVIHFLFFLLATEETMHWGERSLRFIINLFF